MQVETKTLWRAHQALRAAVKEFVVNQRQAINLIDIGLPVRGGRLLEDEVALRFHVSEKRSALALEALGVAPIPSEYREFPTDVLVGRYGPHWGWGWGWRAQPRPRPVAQRDRLDPMCGGASISDEFHIAAGTLGGLVYDRAENTPMLLSNWHVLVTEWWARPGQRILQPGRYDGGIVSEDVVARLERDAMAVGLDAAVAKLTGDRRLTNIQIGLWPVEGVGRPQLGMRVVKSGRSSGRTAGRITGIGGVAKIDYGQRLTLTRLIVDVVTIERDPPSLEVSRAGDSGSLWLNPETHEALGLHFAGSDNPERALAMDLQPVLDALQVDLAVGSAAKRTRTEREVTAGIPVERIVA